MYFDGAKLRFGANMVVYLHTPDITVYTFMYRLDFKCTNNIVEYEALILRLLKEI